ncbi:MAG: methyl-accepting chemotaxis protein, partial [Halobaculum sp.]
MGLDPRESHRRKVLLGFALVVVVGAVAGAATVTSLSDVVQGERTETLEAEADVQDDTVETLLFGLRESALTAADATDRIRTGAETTDGARRQLGQFYSSKTSSDRLSAVHLVDLGSDTVIASSDPSARDDATDQLGLSVPSDVLMDDVVVRLREGTAERPPAWVIYTGTKSGDVLVQVTPLSYVQEELTGVLDESRTRIVNGDGVVVYDSEATGAVGTQHTDGDGVGSPAVRTALNDRKGSTTLSASESPTRDRVVVGYDKIGTTDWAVVSYAEPSALYAAVGLVRRNLALLLGGIAVALLVFGLAVERPAVRELGRLRDRTEALADGDLDTTVEADRRDEFGDLARGLDAMRADLRDRIGEAERAQREAQEARREAESLSTDLAETAETYRDALARVAEGDFTVRVDPSVDHDGMRAVGETLNDVLGELERTIDDVQRFADEVADSMELLSASADEVERSSGDVAETIQSISAGTKDQRQRLQSVTGEMNEMSATVEEIASTSSEVADGAETAAELSREGRDAAEDAADALDEIETATADAVREVEQLVEQVEQIEEFADVIGDVAEQTDMLALNANIEAARTDTDADGFAVVADEIKSLATEAGERAEDIEGLVAEVGEQTDATADRMRTANDRLRESSDTVAAAIDALVEIGEAVESTNQGVQDINRATDDQAATTEEVTATVEEVEEIAAENASEANEAAAAAEEQTATVAEVARTADDVADEAETLRDTAAQFTVDPDGEKTLLG